MNFSILQNQQHITNSRAHARKWWENLYYAFSRAYRRGDKILRLIFSRVGDTRKIIWLKEYTGANGSRETIPGFRTFLPHHF